MITINEERIQINKSNVIFNCSNNYDNKVNLWVFYEDSHDDLLKLIKDTKPNDRYYAEYIMKNVPSIFFNIDENNENGIITAGDELKELKYKLDIEFKDYDRKYIVLTSNNDKIFSAHIILRLSKNIEKYNNILEIKTYEKQDFYLKNINEMKKIFSRLNLNDLKTCDQSIYKTSSKLYKSIYCIKPLYKISKLFIPEKIIFNNDFKNIEKYIPSNFIYIGMKKSIILKNIFINILKKFKTKIRKINDIKKISNEKGYLLEYDGICPISNRKHSLYKNYIILGSKYIKLSCSSKKCKIYINDKRSTSKISLSTQNILSKDEYNILFNIIDINKIELIEDINDFCIDNIGCEKLNIKDINEIENNYSFNTLKYLNPKIQKNYPNDCKNIINNNIYKTYLSVSKKLDLTIEDYIGSDLQNKINNNNYNIINNNIKKNIDLKREDLNFIYNLFNNKEKEEAIIDCIIYQENDSIAKLFSVLKPPIIYSLNDNSFFSYIKKENIWIKDLDFTIGKELFTLYIKNIFNELKSILSKENYLILEENINSILKKIQSYKFVNESLKSYQSYCYHLDFLSILNSKKNIISFKNGVYDILKKSFREHKIDDYITKKLSYDYDSNIKNEILELYLSNLFPLEEEKEYFLKVISTSLDIRIPNDNIYLLIEKSKSKEKSILLNLLNITFGHLLSFYNLDLFYNEYNNNNINLKNKKLIYLLELENLNSNIIKDIYKLNLNLKSKFILSCDNIPNLIEYDNNLLKKLKIIEIKNEFINESNNEKFKNLNILINDDNSFLKGFFNILINNLKPITKIPKKYQNHIKKYFYEKNNLNDFLKNNLIINNNSREILIFKEILKKYFGEDDEIPIYKSKEYNILFKYVKSYMESINNYENSIQYGLFRYNKKRYFGWKGIILK